MEALVRYLDLSKELIAFLQASKSKSDTEAFTQKLNWYFDERDQLLPNIHPPKTNEERKIGQEIMRMNQTIEALLNEVKGSMQKEFSMFKQKQVTSTKYANPYEISIDGMFYDKRN